MQQVYFLIPGLILSSREEPLVSSKAIETLSRLSTNLTDEPVVQSFHSRAFSRSVHLIWAWSVLCRRALPAVCAPYVWSVNQGPQLANEVWSLTLAHADENGALSRIDPTEAAVEAFCSSMTVPLRERGFRLQRWDRTLYLTRKTPWGVAARPFEALEGHAPDAAIDLEPATESAESVDRAVDDLNALNHALAAAGLSCSGRAVNTLWISGGGCYSNFYPPTRIRSVLTDDDAITGWALAAGILNHRLGKITNAETWPADAPNGECIAVIDALYKPWLARDWTLWQERLDAVVAQVDALSAAARRKGCDHAVIVGCGEGLTLTLLKKNNDPKSFLSRLAPGKKLSARSWLFAQGAASEEAQRPEGAL